MMTIVRVLVTYLVIAYVFSGLLCYLVFLRDFYKYGKSSEFNLRVLVHLWIVGLWPMWIMMETFKDTTNTDTAQESSATRSLRPDPDRITRNGKGSWS
jgi:hypothetical protein